MCEGVCARVSLHTCGQLPSISSHLSPTRVRTHASTDEADADISAVSHLARAWHCEPRKANKAVSINIIISVISGAEDQNQKSQTKAPEQEEAAWCSGSIGRI